MRLPHQGDYQYNYIVSLQQRVVNLERRLQAAKDESGITLLREKMTAERSTFERKIARLERALAAEKAKNARVVKERNRFWMKVTDEMEAYAEKKIKEAQAHAEEGWKQAQRIEAELLKALEQIAELKCAAAEKDLRIEELEGQLQARDRLLKQDHTNSSIPSSAEGVRKRSTRRSSRQKSDNRAGAQEGHKGHGRPKMEPTEPAVFVAGPPQIAESDEWVLVDVRRKMLADMEIRVKVTPYDFAVYRHVRTGRIYRTEIPDELHNEVNYGPKLKAAIVLAHTEMNLPARKVREFLAEVSGGAVTVSHGFIAGLTGEFADKSEMERREIAKALLLGEFMHIDSTSARCDGAGHCVTTNANESAVLLSYSRNKGHAAAEKTPYAMGYAGCGVHDDEATFSNYVEAHQQCHAHLLRHLEDAIENEPEYAWAEGFRDLFRKMTHDRKSWPDCGPAQAWKDEIQTEYTRLVNLGLSEYEKNPPNKYYPHGLNLLNRLIEKRDAILFFLDHPNVPHTNNAAETALRPVKRKQAAAMCWRSAQSLDDYCRAKSVLSTERKNGRSCFKKAVEVMSRPRSAHTPADCEGPVTD